MANHEDGLPSSALASNSHPVNSSAPTAPATTSPKKPLPNEIYSYRTEHVKLRVATGSSGVTKLLKTLAEAYIRHCVEDKKEDPFQIGWYATNTYTSIEYLAADEADVAITYHPFLEQAALEMGTVDHVAYGWKDRWMLIGPSHNPAQLKDDYKESIYRLFMNLYIKMEGAKGSKTPIEFLSRWDKSASNLKEQEIWSFLGHAPWVNPESSWYKKTPTSSFEAVRLAAEKGYYALTSYGVWCALSQDVGNKLKVFALGSELETDPLLKPAHLCIATNAENKQRATDFVNWVVNKNGGQAIIKLFKQNEEKPYTAAPDNVNPLGYVHETTKPKDEPTKPKDELTKPKDELAKPVDTKPEDDPLNEAPQLPKSRVRESANPSVAPGGAGIAVRTATIINGTDSTTQVTGDTERVTNGGALPPPSSRQVQPTTDDKVKPAAGDEKPAMNGQKTGANVTGCGTLAPATVPEHLPYEGTAWAAVPHPTDKSVVWIFRDGSYIRYHIWQDKVLSGPNAIREGWPGLYQYGFDSVDAVVPVTQYDTFAWFFYGGRCMLVDLNTGQLKSGEKPFYWADKWPALKSTGWTRFDSAWSNFHHGAFADTVFFRGKDCIRTHLVRSHNTKGVLKIIGTIHEITDAKFGRDKVDMIVSNNEWNKVYFLSGTEYVGVTFKPYSHWGPSLTKDYWPGMKSIGWV